MVRLTLVMLVLMCTSMAWARSINPAAANLEQSEASPNETASCMTRFLQLLTPTILDIPGKELVMRNLPPPIIDEANSQSSRLLSGVLGGAGRAQQLVSYLSSYVHDCMVCVCMLFGLGAHGKPVTVVPVTHTRPVPLFIQPLPLSRHGYCRGTALVLVQEPVRNTRQSQDIRKRSTVHVPRLPDR